LNWATCTTFTNAYIILVGKPEEKRKIRRPRVRCEDNVRMFLGKYGLDSYGSG